MKRYFKLSLDDVIWEWDTDANKACWRNINTGKFSTSSEYTLEQIVSGPYAERREIIPIWAQPWLEV